MLSLLGGVGINLTAASRLIMLDCDWNPAADIQAMSRIWRQGQKKHVFVYRFVSKFTIEDAIIMRQRSKNLLQNVFESENPKAEEVEETAAEVDPEDIFTTFDFDLPSTKTAAAPVSSSERFNVRLSLTRKDIVDLIRPQRSVDVIGDLNSSILPNFPDPLLGTCFDKLRVSGLVCDVVEVEPGTSTMKSD